jgi:hypothetical protein
MRIWDLPVEKLCKNHLLGEHRELHAIWNIISQDKKGYSKHPETKRWKGKLKALYIRHEELVTEIKKRGYNHNSSLDARLAVGKETQDECVDSIDTQIKILKNKMCKCEL